MNSASIPAVSFTKGCISVEEVSNTGASLPVVDLNDFGLGSDILLSRETAETETEFCFVLRKCQERIFQLRCRWHK